MDINYLLFLQELRIASGGIFDSFMLTLTTLGEAAITWGLLALCYWCIDKRTGQLMALNVSFGATLNQGIKNIFKVERPWVQDSRIVPVEKALSHAGGYSFPSGHTTRATAVWGSLGKALWKKREKMLAGFCTLVCLMVAFTRNYLGVHTLKDVLTALIMGFFLIFVLDFCLSWVEDGKNRDLMIGIAGCVVFLAFMLRVGCLGNAGAGVGILLGWIVEKRYINFETEGKLGKKVFRFFMGAFLLVFFYTVPVSILGCFVESKYAAFFANFLFAFILMAGYPYIFCKFETQMKEKEKIAGIVCAGMIIISFLGIGLVQNIVNKAEESVREESMENEPGQQENAEVSDEISEAVEENLDSSEVKIVAHRGYSSMFPENTMAAFMGACELGVDYIELDVQLTADGIPVVFHDTDMARITGQSGLVSDYTYEELVSLDAGSWFDADFAGEKIPNLQEALEYISAQNCMVYLELKDCGEVPGFEECVVEMVHTTGMQDRVMYASFNYEYLRKIKEIDAESEILYNTTLDKKTMIQEYPAEYYGLYLESATADLVETIHEAGGEVFVWTVTTPQEMVNLTDMGVDGIVTNYPGLAKVMIHEEYAFLAEQYVNSFTMPGLYEPWLPEGCENVVVQGFTKTPQYIFISAYSKMGENSILFVMNLSGKLINVVDLQFVAHTGGISYDSVHDYLWITGPEGRVYAISYGEVVSGTYAGDILVQFDAGLTNHNGSKVASFLTWFENELFVGSYVDGTNGVLKRYDLTDAAAPALVSEMQIPQRIQGITFWRDANADTVQMFLSQGYQTLDAGLLCFDYDTQITIYENPKVSYVLPEGAEQIQATTHGMYLLFESAALPYRETARRVNDQVYLIRIPE